MSKRLKKMRFYLALCLILSVKLTGGSLSAETVKTVEWDTIVKKNDPAPFTGVLVPEDGYRFYQVDADLYATCQDRLKASVGLCPESDPWFSSRQLMFFGFGFFAGFIFSEKMDR